MNGRRKRQLKEKEKDKEKERRRVVRSSHDCEDYR